MNPTVPVDFTLYAEDGYIFQFPINTYRVVDGDTVEVNLDLGFKIKHEVDIRINGINTPEVRGRELVGGWFQVVEKWFKDNVSKAIVCYIYKLDKYGGRAGDFLISGEGFLSTYLSDNGLSQNYNGLATITTR